MYQSKILNKVTQIMKQQDEKINLYWQNFENGSLQLY